MIMANDIPTTIFNKCVSEGKISTAWKEPIIHPILQPGKSSLNLGDYGEITLTPCRGKILENIQNIRLEWFLGQITNTAHCNLITSIVQIRWTKNEMLTAIFLDIHKNCESNSQTTRKHHKSQFLLQKSKQETTNCQCGRQDTLRHVLLKCPNNISPQMDLNKG